MRGTTKICHNFRLILSGLIFSPRSSPQGPTGVVQKERNIAADLSRQSQPICPETASASTSDSTPSVPWPHCSIRRPNPPLPEWFYQYRYLLLFLGSPYSRRSKSATLYTRFLGPKRNMRMITGNSNLTGVVIRQINMID